MNEPKKGIVVPLERLIALATINSGKFAQTVEALQKAVDQGEDYTIPDFDYNQDYVSNKLHDLITHQFTRSGRELIELIANSIDAGSKNIQFVDRGDEIIIKDDGSGMTFETLLYDLALPFFSGKVDKIGRFGVGFYSILNVVQRGGRVIVDTQNGTHYRAVYFMEDGKLTVRYSKHETREPGTTIHIQLGSRDGFFGRIKNKLGLGKVKSSRKLIEEYVQYVPPERCIISCNGKQINFGYPIPIRQPQTYSIPFDRETIEVVLGLPKKDYGDQLSLSGGVYVTHDSFALDMITDYPLSCQLVEGRNAFIKDKRFRQAQREVFVQAILPYLEYIKEHLPLATYDRILRSALHSRIFLGVAATGTTDEVCSLLSVYFNKDMSSERPIIISRNRHMNLDRFYSGALVVDPNNVGHIEIIESLLVNPNLGVIDFQDVKESATRVQLRDMSEEQRMQYSLRELETPDITVYLIEGPQDTVSPFASNFRYHGEPVTELYINKNHGFFHDELPESTRKSALDFFLKTCLYGIEEAENRTMLEIL
ncbi:ATP-binding protein [Candidatus Woesearchaeota archaeon]|nr:ATP-binding protein [Candidatus Woesearchaeota archaeon]